MLGTSPYERSEVRRGYRNGIRERTLTGPTGPVALALPRATLFRGAGATEWTSRPTPVTSPRITVVFRCFLRIARIGEAIYPGISAEIATWYRSGWNRWWFSRSTSTTRAARHGSVPGEHARL